MARTHNKDKWISYTNAGVQGSTSRASPVTRSRSEDPAYIQLQHWWV